MNTLLFATFAVLMRMSRHDVAIHTQRGIQAVWKDERYPRGLYGNILFASEFSGNALRPGKKAQITLSMLFYDCPSYSRRRHCLDHEIGYLASFL